MKTSNNITNIIPALMKVKSEMKSVSKTSDNPFYKSKYADLNSHLEAVEDLLSKNGLILMQPTGIDEQGTYVESIIYHTSGEFISSAMRLVLKQQDMQQAGAAVTYGRRFTLGSLLSMKAEDDDGEVAVGRGPAAKSSSQSISGSNNTQVTISASTSSVGGKSETIEGSATMPAAKPSNGTASGGFAKPVKKGAWS